MPEMVSNNSKPKKGSAFKAFLLRLLWIPGIIAYKRKAKADRLNEKVTLDQELRLYSEMFPSGFLHYGYFQDPDVKPEALSFGDLDQAQIDYAQNLIDLIIDHENPVLDVGCGTGGISEMLVDQGVESIALTPDRHQVAYIKANRQRLTVIESTFEDFDDSGYEGKFGSLLTSESLQYLDLEVSLPKIKRLLKPGGRWVACDYFLLAEEAGKKDSGHDWQKFTAALEQHGFKITHEQDITPNILPTLLWANMLNQRLIRPSANFVSNKLQAKAPGIYYVLEPLFALLSEKASKAEETVEPVSFAEKKRYVTLVMELK